MVTINGLTNETSPVEADEVVLVDDVSGTPTTKKATLANLLATYDAKTSTFTNKTFDANGTGNSISNIDLADLSTGAKLEVWGGAMSDETTVLSQGTGKLEFQMPYAFTVTEVIITLTTAGTGAALVTVDINEGGVSILSTKLTIDASEKTSATAATPAVISDSSLAANSVITCDLDTIDTDNVATGLKVYIKGYQT